MQLDVKIFELVKLVKCFNGFSIFKVRNWFYISVLEELIMD